MDIVKFFELIKQYTNIKSDQDLFDAFFLCFDESGLIKRKNESSYGFDSGQISKIMSHSRDIPKTYIDAAKIIDIKLIEKSISQHILKKLDENDIKRIKIKIVESITSDNYYTQEEKEQIISKSYDDNPSNFIAYSFIRILLKTGQNTDYNSLNVKCFFDNKVLNSIKCNDLLETGNTILTNAERIIDDLINTINNIHLGNDKRKEKNIDKNSEIKNIDLKQIEETKEAIDKITKQIEPLINFTKVLGKKYIFSDDNKLIINTYVEKMGKTLSDDFYDLGDMTESSFSTPFSAPEKYGTEQEKEKYSFLMKLVRTLNHYYSLFSFIHYQEMNYSLKLILNNETDSDDKNILITLYFPKGTLVNSENYVFDDAVVAQYFCKLYDDFLKIEETSDIELCNFIPGTQPTVNYSHVNTDFLGRYDKDLEDTNNANDLNDELRVYKYINDKDYDVIRFEFNNIRKQSMCFFPASILLKSIPKKIGYDIKSTNNDTKLTGTIK